MSKDLNPDKALIFRITHRDNAPWILDNGLHCGSSEILDPDFVSIGNQDLIEKRKNRIIDIPPGGPLSDYIPFYFTPFSPMMYNISTGYSVEKRPNREIVILVSSLHKLVDDGKAFVFSDRHAYLEMAQFHNDLTALDCIDWPMLQARKFKKIRMIRKNLSAIRRRRWFTSICPLISFWELSVTIKRLRRDSVKFLMTGT